MDCLAYLLFVQGHHELPLYVQFRGSFAAYLQQMDLLHRYTVPFTFTVEQLLNQVQYDMESSPHQYRFTTVASSHILPSEAGPLQLWSLMNKGTRHSKSGQSFIRACPDISPASTLENLLTAHPKAFVHDMLVSDGYLDVYIGKLYLCCDLSGTNQD